MNNKLKILNCALELFAQKGYDAVGVKEIVDTEGKSYTTPWFGQLMTGPQLIAYLIQLNIWMKEYNVNILI